MENTSAGTLRAENRASQVNVVYYYAHEHWTNLGSRYVRTEQYSRKLSDESNIFVFRIILRILV